MPGLLGLAQREDERQLDVVQEVLEPALAQLLALAGRELVDQHGLDGLRVVGLDGHAALLGQLGERVAAAGRVEQVGGDLRVEDEVLRDLAERLRVVRDDGAVARGRDELGGIADVADERERPAGVRAEAPAAVARDQLALRGLRRDCAASASSAPLSFGTSAAAPLRVATSAPPRPRAAGSRRRPRRRAPPPAGAAGRAARTRGTSPAGGCGRARA